MNDNEIMRAINTVLFNSGLTIGLCCFNTDNSKIYRLSNMKSDMLNRCVHGDALDGSALDHNVPKMLETCYPECFKDPISKGMIDRILEYLNTTHPNLLFVGYVIGGSTITRIMNINRDDEEVRNAWIKSFRINRDGWEGTLMPASELKIEY